MALEPISISVLNLPVFEDADVRQGKAVITGILEEILLDGSPTLVATPFNAGVASVKDYDFTIVPLVDGTAYRFVTRLNDEDNTEKVYIVELFDGATVTDLRDAIRQAIDNDTSSFVTTSLNGAKLRLTAKEVDFDILVEAPDGVAETVITPHETPAGTFEIVEGFAPGKGDPAAEYTTYDIAFKRERVDNNIAGATVEDFAVVKVFADEQSGGVGFKNFNVMMLSIFKNQFTDLNLRDSGKGSNIFSATGFFQLFFDTNVVVAPSGGGFLLGLPPASIGQRLFFARSNTGLLQLFRSGDDLIDGLTVSDIPVGQGSILMSDGIETWTTIIRF